MFDWSKLVDLSEELLDHQSAKVDEELIHRSVINRLYYGAHSTARLGFEMRYGNVPNDENIHGFVIYKYKKSKDAKARLVGAALARLRLYRNGADYSEDSTTHAGDNYSRELCKSLISQARSACLDAKNCNI